MLGTYKMIIWCQIVLKRLTLHHLGERIHSITITLLPCHNPILPPKNPQGIFESRWRFDRRFKISKQNQLLSKKTKYATNDSWKYQNRNWKSSETCTSERLQLSCYNLAVPNFRIWRREVINEVANWIPIRSASYKLIVTPRWLHRFDCRSNSTGNNISPKLK